MKLLVAVNNKNGLYTKLSDHFGHCNYFAIYDNETKELKFVNNNIDHNNTSITPIDQIMKYSPDIIFSLGMGAKALDLFNKKEIKVRTGNFTILKEVINNINDLCDLKMSCKQLN